MRYVTFSIADPAGDRVAEPRLGIFIDDKIVEISTQWDASHRLSLLELIKLGPEVWRQVPGMIDSAYERYMLDEVSLHSPLLNPTSLRDFYAFETHVRSANANRGRDVPAAWYEIPVFYFSNHQAILGPGDTLQIPAGSSALDYELEVACVIGQQCRNLQPADAEDVIFGYMIFNDWSARDLQRHEMSVGLGPAKGKDFASSFGPYLVTPDELRDRHDGRPGVFDLGMVARVNGVERSRGNWSDLHYSFGDMLARASVGVTLYPGDVIGSGTVGTGCLLELTKGQGPWLQPGDTVELEIERLGTLTNLISH